MGSQFDSLHVYLILENIFWSQFKTVFLPFLFREIFDCDGRSIVDGVRWSPKGSLIWFKFFLMKFMTNKCAYFSSFVTSLFLLEENPILSFNFQIFSSKSSKVAGLFFMIPDKFTKNFFLDNIEIWSRSRSRSRSRYKKILVFWNKSKSPNFHLWIFPTPTIALPITHDPSHLTTFKKIHYYYN